MEKKMKTTIMGYIEFRVQGLGLQVYGFSEPLFGLGI